MTIRTRITLLVGLVAMLPSVAPAAERHEEFLEAMRRRTYFDTALEFLDRLESRPGLTPEERKLIPYERAVTLQAYARTSRNPDERIRMLSDAEKLLAEFVRDHPGDERLADANGRRAKILLDRAEGEIQRAERPANADRAETLRTQAREFVAEARTVFQTAVGQFEKRYESFPKFSNDDEVVAARNAAENDMVQARIDLALCTFTEARTYPDGDAERIRMLDRAAEEFREIASENRLLRVGMYATLWEGKCFEEQGKFDVAISLYQKLLELREGEDPRDIDAATQRIRDQALWFKLGCWNKQGLHRLVFDKANEDDGWLRTAGRRADGFNGLGIQLELARAEEQLARTVRLASSELDAQGKPREAAEARDQSLDLLRAALRRAKEIARFATPFQNGAVELANRLETELEGDTGAPRDFKTAFIELGRTVTSDIPAANDAVQKSDDPVQQLELKRVRDDLLDEAEELARLTVALGREPENPEETKPEDVNRAWYYLGYVKYQQNHNWDAAAVGLWLGRTRATEDPDASRRGAYLAVAAMQQELRRFDAGTGDREFELLLEATGFLDATFPEESETNQARMIVAGTYEAMSDPVNAAAWYSRVTDTFPGHLEAQVKAGTAFWDAYLRAPYMSDEDRPDAATLASWRKQAVENLERGVALAEKSIPEDGPESQRQPLILGKITLADILIDDGREQRALDVLTGKPHSVLEAVEIEFGERRPRAGIQSAVFAREAYKRLLRARIGLNQTDEARYVMLLLEDVSVDSDLLELYRDLGRNLQDEIERLKQLDQSERLADVRAAFDGFLDKLYEGRNVLPYNTLLWIGASYFGIGSGMGDDDAAVDYFQKAADVYRVMIDKAASDADFAPGIPLDGVRLRLITCLRRLGDFEDAEKLAMRIVTDEPTSMEAQKAIAAVLVDWAATKPADALEKYRKGLQGAEVVHAGRQVKIRGWRWIVSVYSQEWARTQGRSENAGLVDDLADAKYAYLDALAGLADVETDPTRRKASLSAAAVELTGVARGLGVSLDAEQKSRFQKLFNRVQRELGVPETSLVWAKPVERRPPPEQPEQPTETADAGTEAADTEGAAAAEQSGGLSTITMVFGFLIAVGIGVGCFVLMSRPTKRGSSVAAAATPEPVFAEAEEQPRSRRRRKAVIPGTGGGKPVRPKKRRPKSE